MRALTWAMAAAVATAMLAGCASTGSSLKALGSNASQSTVRATLGEPLAMYDGVQEAQGGSIWFYDRDARNLQRERVVFDAQGQMQQHGPAWGRAAFEQIQAGWSTQTLLHHVGPPLRQQAPRLSLMQGLGLSSTEESFRPSPQAQTAKSSHWMYGFRESGKFFTVTVVVTGSNVTGVDITEDTQD